MGINYVYNLSCSFISKVHSNQLYGTSQKSVARICLKWTKQIQAGAGKKASLNVFSIDMHQREPQLIVTDRFFSRTRKWREVPKPYPKREQKSYVTAKTLSTKRPETDENNL